MWCPLDDVSPENGTLTLIPMHDTDGGEAVGGDPDATDPSNDPASAVTLTLAAGDVVMFDSNVWHRSGPNNSSAYRRVLYAQYSPGVVTTTGIKALTDEAAKPICFAVPCEVTMAR